ncbi:MAG TPA: VCBS repeat-containing protein [Vicinamibacterales bacterium]|nr:VCBS repeat-containing protein [Vicinamibacterales bacterium]
MPRFPMIACVLALAPALSAAAGPATPQPGDYRLVAPFEAFNPSFYYCEERVPACSWHEPLEAVWVGDMNGDGRDDVVTAPGHNEFWILLQKPDGTLETADYRVHRYAEENYTVTKAVALGDFNEDGALDLVSNAPDHYLQGMVMLMSDGDGGHALELREDTVGLREFRRVFARDVDRDGHLDLVFLGSVQQHEGPGLAAMVRFGDGTGGFPRHATTFFPDANVIEMQMADFNGDGHDDIAVQAVVGFPGDLFLAISYHDGDEGFGPLLVTDQSFHYGSAIGDFDGDGAAEISGFEGGEVVAVSITGDRVAGYHLMAPIANLSPFRFLVADLDLDGRVDLYSEEYLPGTVRFATVHLQLEAGWIHAQGNPYDGPFLPDNISNHLDGYAAGDINGDGCTDVVTANQQSGLAFHLGSHCMPAQRVEVGANCGILWRVAGDGAVPAMDAGDHGWRAARGDFDGDGQEDLLWHGPGRHEAEFWPGGRAREALTLPIDGLRSPADRARPEVGTKTRTRQGVPATPRR